LRLLGLAGGWSPAELRPLLTGCPHLAALRELYFDYLESGPALSELGRQLHMPAVEALFIGYVGGDDTIAFLGGFTNPLKRLILQRVFRDTDCVGWLSESPHCSSLRQLGIWYPEDHTNAIAYTTPGLPDLATYLTGSMEDLRLHRLADLVACPSWGKLRTLRLGQLPGQGGVAELARIPQCGQLERLFFEFTDDDESVRDRLGDISSDGPYLANLRHLRMDLAYCREDPVPCVATGPYRERLLRLDLHGIDMGGAALDEENMAELLARPWPELRTLCLDAGVADVGPLLTTTHVPNLCTLWVGTALPEPLIQDFARARNLPHLSLFVEAAGDWRGREWVLGGGVARPVAPGIRLLETDLLESPAW
jgi:hypothetical protein